MKTRPDPATIADAIEAMPDSNLEEVAAAARWCRERRVDPWSECPCGAWCLVIALATGVAEHRCLIAAARTVSELANEWGDDELRRAAERMVRYVEGRGESLSDDEMSDLEVAADGADDVIRAITWGLIFVSMGAANGYPYEAVFAARRATDGFVALGYTQGQAGAITAEIVRRTIVPSTSP